MVETRAMKPFIPMIKRSKTPTDSLKGFCDQLSVEYLRNSKRKIHNNTLIKLFKKLSESVELDGIKISHLNTEERKIFHKFIDNNKYSNYLHFSTADKNTGKILNVLKIDRLEETIRNVCSQVGIGDISKHKILNYWHKEIDTKYAAPDPVYKYRPQRRMRHCENCDATSDETEILGHWSGMWCCIEYIEDDDELRGLKWEDC